VLVVGYVNNILKEDYVRFLDGKALASALAGELRGHRTGLPLLARNLTTFIVATEIGDVPPLRPFGTPTSPVFEASVGKLGLLGNALAGDVAYLYELIRAFRLNYAMVTEQVAQMKRDELLARLTVLRDMVVDNQPIADATIAGLNAYADQQFLPWITRRLGLVQFAGRVSSRPAATATINPTQGDDPSGSAR